MAFGSRAFEGLRSQLEPAAWGARFNVDGRVTSGNVCRMISDVVADLAQARPLVALCDYRAVDMGATARGLVLAHRRSGVAAMSPTALVVQRDQLEVWDRYAYLQGQIGNLKAVFTDVEQAERWSSDMAAIQAAQARFRTRRG